MCQETDIQSFQKYIATTLEDADEQARNVRHFLDSLLIKYGLEILPRLSPRNKSAGYNGQVGLHVLDLVYIGRLALKLGVKVDTA